MVSLLALTLSESVLPTGIRSEIAVSDLDCGGCGGSAAGVGNCSARVRKRTTKPDGAPAGEKRKVGRDLRRDEGKERSREICGRGGELELVGHARVCGGFGARKKLELLLKNPWGRN